MRYEIRSKTVLLLKASLLLCGLALTQGCGTRTVLVRPGDPIQIREPVKAKVWVIAKDGARLDSEATIPAGWYAIDAPAAPNE